ncbi:THAP domain-containing protein 5-like isoform X1 [Neodiprion pinetum]|uniref:THAP domain-containing protein 5-like isoform X1 n=2 Tax=Neodiprion pinetum TaxID=441929 RepID=UPI001EDDA4F9|nr:THAP domain-containing protein 5-like isoform X1 [Neodiprion pinetum]
MQKMQSCCITGCDSYKETNNKRIGYFKFPLHNTSLLNRWLLQINNTGFKLSETSQICSEHFQRNYIDWHLNKKNPHLLPNAVPTIFPCERKMPGNKGIDHQVKTQSQNTVQVKPATTLLQINESQISEEITHESEPHRSKVTLLKRKPAVPVALVHAKHCESIETEMKFGIDSKLRKILSKPNEEVSTTELSSEKPLLKIIVYKKLSDVQVTLNPMQFETIYLPAHKENEDHSKNVTFEKKVWISKQSNQSIDEKNFTGRENSSSKSTISSISNEISTPKVKQYTNNKSKPKNTSCVPTLVKSKSKITSQGQMYSHSTVSKVQSPNSEDRQDSDQLRERLKELKARRQREQSKITRLQFHLTQLEKKIEESSHEKVVLPSSTLRSKPTGPKSTWLIREKEEYEKLLKDVREMKLKVLRQRHTRELEKVRKLQIQMANLSKKMKENDEREIAAMSNLRRTRNATIPNWMKREEDEYEKLLQDVRKIKQSYMLRQSKQISTKPNSPNTAPSETASSDDECILIETIPETIELMEEIEVIEKIKDESRLMHRIEEGSARMKTDGYSQTAENSRDCGEIIEEIDEEWIEISGCVKAYRS